MKGRSGCSELRGDVEDDLEGEARYAALWGAIWDGCGDGYRCLGGGRTTVVGTSLDRQCRGVARSESIMFLPILESFLLGPIKECTA